MRSAALPATRRPGVASRPDPRAGAERAAERRAASSAGRNARSHLGGSRRGRRRGRARRLVARALQRSGRGERHARRARRPERPRARDRGRRGESRRDADRPCALVVRRLAPAPRGKDYEIWVFENGVPQRAGLFERPGVAMLSRRVARGQTIAVTPSRTAASTRRPATRSSPLSRLQSARPLPSTLGA